MKLYLTPGHPRLYIKSAELRQFRALSRGPRKQYRTALLKWLDPVTESMAGLRARVGTDSPEQQALALGQAWQLTQDERYARAAQWLLESLEHCVEALSLGYDAWGISAEAGALLYDWLHDYWKREGLERVAARATLYCARRALDESLRCFIVDDWHNYYLGLQAGALAGALAIGYDHPDLENGELLRTLHALQFTGSQVDGFWIQDAYQIPKTKRCLETALRAGNCSGFAGHLEASGAYHSVDALEFVKMAEWWTSALSPSSRSNKIIWPETVKAGEPILQFGRPNDEGCIIHGDAGPYRPHMRQAIIMLHLHARTPRREFGAWLEQHTELTEKLTPMHALLRWQPLQTQSRPWSDGLPTAARIDPIVVLRSSWKRDATMVTFRCGMHGGWHNHLDHNSFTIYRGGALAIDSGAIDYTSPHRPEYALRTLAHNAILVRDPNEKHWIGKLAAQTNNDGGQRLVPVSYNPPNEFTGKPHAIICEERRKHFADEFDMGEIVAFESGEHVDYVAGDATRAYTYPWSGIGDNPSRRVEEAVRQIVFLKPEIIVIFDRVEATRAHFEKKWLLHSINAPIFFNRGRARKAPRGSHQIPAQGPFEFTQENGRLTVWPLLPDARSVRAVGGKGFEFWVDHAVDSKRGKNYPPQSSSQRETGAWRVEISPKKKQSRDCFLTIMHAGLLSDRSVRDSIQCQAREDHGVIHTSISLYKSPFATLKFRTAGRIEVEIEYRHKNSRFGAAAPKRVPRADK